VVHSKQLFRKRTRMCAQLPNQHLRAERGQRGQSLIQLIIAIAVMMILAALAVPNINQTIAMERVRTRAADLASMMQNARLQATKTNSYVPIQFNFDVNTGLPIAWADLNGDGAWQAINPQEPVTYFSPSVFWTLNPPPANYVLVGDTGAGAFPAGTVLAFSPRGLPCAYNPGPPIVCTTPAAQYFTFYITDNRPNPDWAAVIVTKGGRSKVQIWHGNAWGN
jgi:type II secretory pathway pseudopilin PulG